MPKRSAGILAYRFHQHQPQVLLVHPGGPFFANKDAGAWSIPKGEYEAGEDPLAVAIREFNEETGNTLPAGEFTRLTDVKLKSGKQVSAWAIEANFTQPYINSNTFDIEWPPHSGKMRSFPEADKASWFTLEEAEDKIHPAQLPLLRQLQQLLSG